MMSGCANSEAVLGTSLPKKGMASLRRERGVCGSSFCSLTTSAAESSPKETRSTFWRQWGMNVESHSSARLSICIALAVSSPPLSLSCSIACSRSCACAALPRAAVR